MMIQYVLIIFICLSNKGNKSSTNQPKEHSFEILSLLQELHSTDGKLISEFYMQTRAQSQ